MSQFIVGNNQRYKNAIMEYMRTKSLRPVSTYYLIYPTYRGRHKAFKRYLTKSINHFYNARLGSSTQIAYLIKVLSN